MEDQHAAARLHEALLSRRLTLATAESLTGGALADLLSSAPGASATYRGGVVSYATEVKVSVLGVRDETVATHGVVSAACATEMAAGVRRLVGADWALATTGVAGPDRQEGKPVGTVFVGVAGPSGVVAVELRLSGGRDLIRALTCAAAVRELLWRVPGQTGQ